MADKVAGPRTNERPGASLQRFWRPLSGVVALHSLLYGAVDKGVDGFATGFCVGLNFFSSLKGHIEAKANEPETHYDAETLKAAAQVVRDKKIEA